MPEIYYVDTCIWLNLFKKEGDSTKGKPYWEIARDFLDKVAVSNNKILVSTIVLKELSFKVESQFPKILDFLKNSDYIEIIKTTTEDYDFARNLENTEKVKLSFYDYLHIAIAKRLSLHLITRDKDLIVVAKEYVKVNKPEDLMG